MSKGNEWWRKRSTRGRNKIFESPNDLWESCCEYFESVDERKWNLVDFRGKDANRVEVPHETPYTKTGLCLFLDIDMDTWTNYSKKEGYEEFFGVTRAVNNIMFTQKFEGAAVGAFQANIIARDLGLAEQMQTSTDATISISASDEQQKSLDGLMDGPPKE